MTETQQLALNTTPETLDDSLEATKHMPIEDQCDFMVIVAHRYRKQLVANTTYILWIARMAEEYSPMAFSLMIDAADRRVAPLLREI